jgi:hypothetical protein
LSPRSLPTADDCLEVLPHARRAVRFEPRRRDRGSPLGTRPRRARTHAAGGNVIDISDPKTLGAGRSSLGRFLSLLEPVELDTAGGGDPRWLRSGGWRLYAGVREGAPPDGETIAIFSSDSEERFTAVQRPDGTVYLPFDPEEAYRNYVTEAWCRTASQHKLSEAQLAFYYRVKKLLPRTFWLTLRRAFIKMGRTPEFPAWPLDTSVERLLRF